MNVRDRLVLTFVLVVGLLVFPSLFAAARLGDLQQLAVGERASHASASLALGRVEAGLAELDRYLRSYVAAPDAQLRQAVFRSLDDLDAQVVQMREAGYEETVEALDRQLRELDADVRQVVELVDEGRLREATDAFVALTPEISATRSGLGDMAAAVDRRATTDFERAEDISTSARGTTLLSILAALIVAVLLSVWTTRALTNPLKQLRDAMSGVEGGHFDAPDDLPYDRQDEIGDLTSSFRAMTRRLDELDRLKAEFIGVASHELKTPINVIRGYTELIEDELVGELTDHQREILHRIAEQTRVMTRLVSRLMDISRLETGSYGMQVEEVLVQDLVLGLKRGYEILAHEKNIHFETEVRDDSPEKIEVDVDLMRDEVLGNLVSNAIKFTPQDGAVRVVARGEGEGVVFEVSDTGPGIPQEHRAHIFEKYYQVERSRAVGSGLGLAIAKELVESHGGWIRLADHNGGGAEFHVYLPAHSPASQPEMARASA